MTKRITYILLLIAILTNSSAHAARIDYNVAFYDQWSSFTNKQLLAKAKAYLYQKDKIDSALVCYTVAANRYYERSLNDEDIDRSLQAMNNLGYMYYYYYCDYQKAYGYLQQCLNLSKKEKSTKSESFAYLNLANLYTTYGDVFGSKRYMEQAIPMYKKAFYKALNNKDWKIAVRSMNALLGIAYEKTDFRNIQKEIDVFKNTPFPRNTELLEYNNLFYEGERASMRGDYKKAMACFAKMPACVNTKDTPERYVIFAYSLCAHVYSLQGNNAEALKYYDIIEKQCRKYNIRDILIDVYKEYFNYYTSVKDESKATKYHLSYLMMKDSMMNENKLKDVSEMSFMNQLKQVNDQVKILYAKRHLQNIIMGIVIGVAVIIIFFMILQIRSYRQLKHSHQILYRNNLETLAREEEERRQRREYQQQLEALHNKEVAAASDKPKTQYNILNEEDKDALSVKIKNVMDNTEEICSDSFSLNRLAELVDAKVRYMSQAINEIYHENFYSLLNEYRIKEACRRLNDIEHYGNLTIEAISASVGFKSRSNFVTTFKRVTGLTPSQYQKMASSKKKDLL